MVAPKAAKRQKVGDDEEAEEFALQLWEHFRNYVDSLNGGSNDPTGDIDELQELIELSQNRVKWKMQNTEEWGSIVDLLPILVSAAYTHLAEAAIAEYLQPDCATNESAIKIQELLTKSLELYPKNAASWSMGANFGRMTHLLSLSTARKWYEQAANYASELRSKSLKILGDENVENAMLKEWVELLIVNHVVGVEFEVDDDVEATTDQDEIEEGADENEQEEDEEGEPDGHYSASAVEGTARFMCAMLGSMAGDHDGTVRHLQSFGMTHRLHPNVWKCKAISSNEIPEMAPLIFSPRDGILPKHLYEGMKKLFAPKAAYWRESTYMERDYYSFFMDYDPERKVPRNLIEDVIVNHLLPRAKQVLSKEEGDSIVGFEWWAHTRPIRANLGHNLHFDTDEALLAQERKITHPILSSILYLTGGGQDQKSDSPGGGVTIILNQTPDSEEVANHCWQGRPVDNAFLLFPGDLLHGVLPCLGKQSGNKTLIPMNDSNDFSELWNGWISPEDRETECGTRLTFMVGFWTRDVPATMKNRYMYGPCGPIPPQTEEHSWVEAMGKGYGGSDAPPHSQSTDPLKPSPLPEVTPAWDMIPPREILGDDDQLLQIPRSIDHRFFVKDAPRCFYDSLFEENEASNPCE